jgi:ribosomal-protein-alanine N-acetyltransferase
MALEHITVRLARPADAQRIALMSRDLIEYGLGWSWQADRVLRMIRRPDVSTVVAMDGGRIVGFAIMQFGDEHAHLTLLAVSPTHQRQGVGQRLVEWLVESAYVAGIAVIHLELRTTNAGARRFYRALGFNEGAFVPGYYNGRETALRMLRELRSPAVASVHWQLPAPPKDSAQG